MSMTATPPLVGITGATGFVGAALVDLLRAKGFRIRVLIRNRARLAVDPAGLEISVGDLGDADGAEQDRHRRLHQTEQLALELDGFALV
ncbi:MAG: NAD(P)H-binding protein, partial [Pseudomonadota bacterium]